MHELLKGTPFKSVEQLRATLVANDTLYRQGKKTDLSDYEYDKYHELYTKITGEMIHQDMNNKLSHDFPELKGTMAKVYYNNLEEKNNDPGAVSTHGTITEWLTNSFRTITELGEHKGSVLVGVYPKYDGVSIQLTVSPTGEVLKAVTRGDTEAGTGEDRTQLFNGINMINYLPKSLKGVVNKPWGLKIEYLLRSDKFKEYNEKYGDNKLINERTAITSLTNSKTITKAHIDYTYIAPLMVEYDGQLISYNEDDEYGPLYTFNFANDINDFSNIIKESHELAKEYYPVCFDGLVFRLFEPDDMKLLGRNDSKGANNFEVAYKFPKPSNYTKLLDIQQDIGLMGKVSFTAKVEPFVFNNKTIKSVSLGSYNRFQELKLAKGDMVNIKYEIIPYLVMDPYCESHRSGNEPIKAITNCPYCNEKLIFNPEYMCGNVNCKSRVIGKIYNYCEKLGIRDIGESTVEALYHAGIVTSIEDLYRLHEKKSEVLQLDGFGEKSFEKIVKSIESVKPTEDLLLGSIGIPNIGRRIFKKIMDIYNLSELLNLTEETYFKLADISGISDKTAKKIYDGIQASIPLIKFLTENIAIIKPVTKNNKSELVVVFTGFRNQKFKEYLESLGIEVTDSVTGKTQLVIAENLDNKTGKVKKAIEKNIPVINVFEAYEKFKFNE